MVTRTAIGYGGRWYGRRAGGRASGLSAIRVDTGLCKYTRVNERGKHVRLGGGGLRAVDYTGMRCALGGCHVPDPFRDTTRRRRKSTTQNDNGTKLDVKTLRVTM